MTRRKTYRASWASISVRDDSRMITEVYMAIYTSMSSKKKPSCSKRFKCVPKDVKTANDEKKNEIYNSNCIWIDMFFSVFSKIKFSLNSARSICVFEMYWRRLYDIPN